MSWKHDGVAQTLAPVANGAIVITHPNVRCRRCAAGPASSSKVFATTATSATDSPPSSIRLQDPLDHAGAQPCAQPESKHAPAISSHGNRVPLFGGRCAPRRRTRSLEPHSTISANYILRCIFIPAVMTDHTVSQLGGDARVSPIRVVISSWPAGPFGQHPSHPDRAGSEPDVNISIAFFSSSPATCSAS
jgi:hypothetical protein